MTNLGTIYGLTPDPDMNSKIQSAIQSAVAAERERCAKVAEGFKTYEICDGDCDSTNRVACLIRGEKAYWE